MSQADNLPARAASPEKFEATLEMLVSTARESDIELDRSWTFRHDDAEDVMVEMTSLAPRPELAEPSTDYPPVVGNMTTGDFEAALKNLLTEGRDAGVTFDRSWTFRNADPDSIDVMVEVTRLAKPSC